MSTFSKRFVAVFFMGLAGAAASRRSCSLIAVVLLLACSSLAYAVPTRSFYQQAVLDQSPVAYWRLNETSGATASDHSRNGNHASYTVAPTLGASGPRPSDFIGFEGSNFAPAFNGTSDQRVNHTLAGLGFDYSVSLWMRNDRPITQDPVAGYAFSRSNGTPETSADSLGLWGTSGSPGRLLVFNGSTVVTGNTQIADNNWHHVALTRSGSNVAVYLDGVLDVAGSLTRTFSNLDGLMTIGTRSNFFGDWLGNLDEVAVWNRALSGEEIGAQYLASQQTFPPAPIPEPMTALLLAPLALMLLSRRTRRCRQ